MFRPIRTLISLALVLGAVWFSFNVRLGSKTFAQHLDAIGDTPQARELLEGTRDTVNPALDEAKQRVLGERVEAPTYIPQAQGAAGEAESSVERKPSDGHHVGVPGRRG